MAKRGRPPLSPGETTTRLTLVLPDSVYDRVFIIAQQARVSVPELIRRTLARELRNTKSANPPVSLSL